MQGQQQGHTGRLTAPRGGQRQRQRHHTAVHPSREQAKPSTTGSSLEARQQRAAHIAQYSPLRRKMQGGGSMAKPASSSQGDLPHLLGAESHRGQLQQEEGGGAISSLRDWGFAVDAASPREAADASPPSTPAVEGARASTPQDRDSAAPPSHSSASRRVSEEVRVRATARAHVGAQRTLSRALSLPTVPSFAPRNVILHTPAGDTLASVSAQADAHVSGRAHIPAGQVTGGISPHMDIARAVVAAEWTGVLLDAPHDTLQRQGHERRRAATAAQRSRLSHTASGSRRRHGPLPRSTDSGLGSASLVVPLRRRTCTATQRPMVQTHALQVSTPRTNSPDRTQSAARLASLRTQQEGEGLLARKSTPAIRPSSSLQQCKSNASSNSAMAVLDRPRGGWALPGPHDGAQGGVLAIGQVGERIKAESDGNTGSVDDASSREKSPRDAARNHQTPPPRLDDSSPRATIDSSSSLPRQLGRTLEHAPLLRKPVEATSTQMPVSRLKRQDGALSQTQRRAVGRNTVLEKHQHTENKAEDEPPQHEMLLPSGNSVFLVGAAAATAAYLSTLSIPALEAAASALPVKAGGDQRLALLHDAHGAVSGMAVHLPGQGIIRFAVPDEQGGNLGITLGGERGGDPSSGVTAPTHEVAQALQEALMLEAAHIAQSASSSQLSFSQRQYRGALLAYVLHQQMSRRAEESNSIIQRRGDDRLLESPFVHPEAHAALAQHERHAAAAAAAHGRWALLKQLVLGDKAMGHFVQAAVADAHRDLAQGTAKACAAAVALLLWLHAQSGGRGTSFSCSDSASGGGVADESSPPWDELMYMGDDELKSRILGLDVNVRSQAVSWLLQHELLAPRMLDALGDAAAQHGKLPAQLQEVRGYLERMEASDKAHAAAGRLLMQGLLLALTAPGAGAARALLRAVLHSTISVKAARSTRTPGTTVPNMQLEAATVQVHPDAIPTPRSLVQSQQGTRVPPHPYMMIQASRLARLGFKDSDSFDRQWARAAHTAPHGGRGSAVTFHSRPSLAGGTVELRGGASMYDTFASLAADSDLGSPTASETPQSAHARAGTPLFKTRRQQLTPGPSKASSTQAADKVSKHSLGTRKESGYMLDTSLSSSPPASRSSGSRSMLQSRGHLSARDGDAPPASADLSTLRRRAGLTAFAKSVSVSGSTNKASAKVVQPFCVPRSSPAVPQTKRPLVVPTNSSAELQGASMNQSEALARQTVSLLTGGASLQHELRVGGRSMPGNLAVQHGIRQHAEVYSLPPVTAIVGKDQHAGIRRGLASTSGQLGGLVSRTANGGAGKTSIVPARVRNEGVGISAVRDIESALFWSRRHQQAAKPAE